MNPKSYSTRFFYLVGGLIISLPFSIFLTNLLGALLFLNTFTTPRHYWKNAPLRTPLPILFLCFFGIYTFSLLWSSNMAEGWQNLGSKTAFLLMPPALATGLPGLTKNQLQRLKQLFILAVSIAAVYAIFFALYRYSLSESWYRYYSDGSVQDHLLFYTGLAEPIMHPGYFSVYVGIAFFLLLQHFKTSRKKILSGIGLAFHILFLIMLQGRINLIAFALIFGFYLLFTLIKKGYYRLLAGAVLIFTALVIAVFLAAPQAVKSRFLPSLSLDYDMSAPSMEYFSSFTIRLAEWKCANEVIEENFWLGAGIGDSKDALTERYRENNFTMGLKNGFNVHNQYLETWMAAGLPGLAILLLMFFFLLVSAFRQRDIYFGMAVLFFFLSMITESMLERHWAITLLCSLILLCGLNGYRKTEKESGAPVT